MNVERWIVDGEQWSTLTHERWKVRNIDHLMVVERECPGVTEWSR